MALSLCALLASHERRESTLAALHALFEQRADGVAINAVLVDDGSRDGTAAAVRGAFANVQVIEGDGRLYWCRAMHRAMDVALAGGHDWLLWLNDDTLLEPGALLRLIECERALRERFGAPVIVVGTTVDAQRAPIYGGRWRGSRWRPLNWRLVAPTMQPQPLHTMDGNLVLLGREVLARVGNLEPRFEHAMGDHDYALRAAKRGVPAWLAPGVHARGALNPLGGGFDDPSLPLAQRWRAMMGRKGLPWRSWMLFTRRHAGWLWPLVFGWPYLRVLLKWPASAHARRSHNVRHE